MCSEKRRSLPNKNLLNDKFHTYSSKYSKEITLYGQCYNLITFYQASSGFRNRPDGPVRDVPRKQVYPLVRALVPPDCSSFYASYTFGPFQYLIVDRILHGQYVNCSGLADHTPPAMRFAIGLIFIECCDIMATVMRSWGFWLRLNEHC